MKKYLTFTAILGAVAFLGVSYLAQADDAMAPAGGAAAEKMAAPAPMDKMAPSADGAAVSDAYMKDRAECDALASAPSTEGATPSAEAKADALKKCLVGKGHTEEEVMKEESKTAPAPMGTDTKAPDAMAPDTMAPAPAAK